MKRMWISTGRTTLAFIAFFLAGVVAPAKPDASSDDYAVYVDFIRQMTWGRAEIAKEEVDTFVILAKTDISDAGSPSIPEHWLVFDEMKWRFPEFSRFPASDGATIIVRLWSTTGINTTDLRGRASYCCSRGTGNGG